MPIYVAIFAQRVQNSAAGIPEQPLTVCIVQRVIYGNDNLSHRIAKDPALVARIKRFGDAVFQSFEHFCVYISRACVDKIDLAHSSVSSFLAIFTITEKSPEAAASAIISASSTVTRGS